MIETPEQTMLKALSTLKELLERVDPDNTAHPGNCRVFPGTFSTFCPDTASAFMIACGAEVSYQPAAGGVVIQERQSRIVGLAAETLINIMSAHLPREWEGETVRNLPREVVLGMVYSLEEDLHKTGASDR